jgi:hypothetical protein
MDQIVQHRRCVDFGTEFEGAIPGALQRPAFLRELAPDDWQESAGVRPTTRPQRAGHAQHVRCVDRRVNRGGYRGDQAIDGHRATATRAETNHRADSLPIPVSPHAGATKMPTRGWGGEG